VSALFVEAPELFGFLIKPLQILPIALIEVGDPVEVLGLKMLLRII
jgi:hypothetical protein